MRLFFFCYFLFLPFQWALSPLPGVDLALIRLATITLILLWLIRGLVLKRLSLPFDVPTFLLSAFLLWASSSLLWADNTLFGVRKALFLFSFLPLFFILVAWLKEYPAERTVLLRAFVVGAFLAALSGLVFFFLQFLFGPEPIFAFLTTTILPFFLGTTFGQTVANYPSLLVNISGVTLLRASGVFPDPHMFSLYLGMAIPVAGIWWWRVTTHKTWWLIIFLTILLADLLSFSRGGYVGLICGTIIFFLGIRSRLRFEKRSALLLVMGLIILGTLLSSSPLGSRFFSSFSRQDGSNIERLRLWQEAVLHIGERPLSGVGLGNYPLLVKPSALYREPIYAHNLFLDIAVELGLIGLALFLGVVGSALLWAGRAWKGAALPSAFAVIVSLAVFLGHAFFETPLFSVHVLPVLLLFLAIGVSYKYHALSS
ncbi:MAG: O-antigen ligase family protein [Candidatus Moranbacteria bacterium]|nr:O-antigen ligase family protein [Candidatus Moranbacteria bacterium]